MKRRKAGTLKRAGAVIGGTVAVVGAALGGYWLRVKSRAGGKSDSDASEG